MIFISSEGSKKEKVEKGYDSFPVFFCIYIYDVALPSVMIDT